MFHVLLGLIPATNQRAIRWLNDVGLKRVGVVPCGLWNGKEDKPMDGVLLSLIREDI